MTVFFLIPGVVCLFLGVVFLLLYRRSSTRAEVSERSMTGKVWAKLADTGSRTEYDYDNRSRTVYFGIYEYDTADGQHLSAASDFGYIDPKDIPGARGNMVKARYNPNAPAEFALEEEQSVSRTVWPKFKKIGMILTALGILFAAAAVAAMLGLFRIPAFASERPDGIKGYELYHPLISLQGKCYNSIVLCKSADYYIMKRRTS